MGRAAAAAWSLGLGLGRSWSRHGGRVFSPSAMLTAGPALVLPCGPSGRAPCGGALHEGWAWGSRPGVVGLLALPALGKGVLGRELLCCEQRINSDLFPSLFWFA